MGKFTNLWATAGGTMSVDKLVESIEAEGVTNEDIADYEEDADFMQECAEDTLGLIVQGMMMGEYADRMDEATQSAIQQVKTYLVGQGVIDEAATVRITNPKINVVHLSKMAQIKRLTTIITLKMARKAGHKAYKKYKLGQKIKKENMAIMRKIYGNKAERLAKKLWAKNQKSAKVNAVVASEKEKGGQK